MTLIYIKMIILTKFHFLTKFHYLEMIRVDFKDQKPELLCQQKLKNDIIN